MLPLGFPKPCGPLGCSCPRCPLRDHRIQAHHAPKIRVQGKQVLHQPTGAILRVFPREQGENHGIPEGVGLVGTWKLPGLSGTSRCCLPSSAPVSTPLTGSEALWAFPLSLKHSFTFQLSKYLKILTTLPLEPEGEPAQLHYGVQLLQLLTKPFLAEPALCESAPHNARVSTSHNPAGAGPGKTQPHPHGGTRRGLPAGTATGMCC